MEIRMTSLEKEMAEMIDSLQDALHEASAEANSLQEVIYRELVDEAKALLAKSGYEDESEPVKMTVDDWWELRRLNREEP
jgi:putative hemolysin